MVRKSDGAALAEPDRRDLRVSAAPTKGRKPRDRTGSFGTLHCLAGAAQAPTGQRPARVGVRQAGGSPLGAMRFGREPGCPRGWRCPSGDRRVAEKGRTRWRRFSDRRRRSRAGRPCCPPAPRSHGRRAKGPFGALSGGQRRTNVPGTLRFFRESPRSPESAGSARDRRSPDGDGVRPSFCGLRSRWLESCASHRWLPRRQGLSSRTCCADPPVAPLAPLFITPHFEFSTVFRGSRRSHPRCCVGGCI